MTTSQESNLEDLLGESTILRPMEEPNSEFNEINPGEQAVMDKSESTVAHVTEAMEGDFKLAVFYGPNTSFTSLVSLEGIVRFISSEAIEKFPKLCEHQMFNTAKNANREVKTRLPLSVLDMIIALMTQGKSAILPDLNHQTHVTLVCAAQAFGFSDELIQKIVDHWPLVKMLSLDGQIHLLPISHTKSWKSRIQMQIRDDIPVFVSCPSHKMHLLFKVLTTGSIPFPCHTDDLDMIHQILSHLGHPIPDKLLTTMRDQGPTIYDRAGERYKQSGSTVRSRENQKLAVWTDASSQAINEKLDSKILEGRVFLRRIKEDERTMLSRLAF